MSSDNGFKFVNEIPENLGFSSAKMLDFIKYVSQKCPLLRAFMLIRDKKIAAEGYFKPFDYKTEFKGITLRSAAKQILSGNGADGFETVIGKDGKTFFIFASGAPVPDGIKNEVLIELSLIESDKDTFNCSDAQAFESLLLYLSELKTSLPGAAYEDETEKTVGGKTYFLLPNDKKIEWVRLSWGDKTAALRFKDKRGENEIYIGRGAYRKFSFAPASADGYAAGFWENKNRFVISICFIGSRTGGMQIAFDFEDGKLKLSVQSTSQNTYYEFEGAEVK